MSRNIRLVGVILATALLLSLVVGVVGTQDDVVLVIGMEQEHARLRNLNTMSWMGYIEGMYARDLWVWDTERNVIPVMVEEMPSMDNGKIGTTDEGNTWIEVNLRDGLMWSDGTPITSTDCEAHHTVRFNRETSPNWGNRGLYPDIVDSFEIVDESTFRITYNVPFPDVLTATERPQCRYPASVINPPLEAGGVVDDNTYWDGVEGSIGFGPFKLVDREPGASWTLVKNEYWPEYFAQPAIDRIIWVLIEDDAQMRNAMRVGDIDLYFNWDPNLASEIEAMEGVEIWNTQGVYSDALWMRTGEIVDEETNAARQALTDVNVRKAIVHALDREFMVDNLVGPGIGVPKSWYPAQMWPDDLPYLEYDVELARQLLTDAGWVDHDGDEGSAEIPTPRQNADGVELTGLRLTTTINELRNNYQLVIQDFLAQVGVGVELVQVTSNHFGSFSDDGTLAAYHFEMSIFANSADPLSPATDVNSYTCGGIPSAENPDGFNAWQFCNDEYDETDVMIATTFPGQERDELIDKAVTLFYEGQFWHGLRNRPTFYALNVDRWDLDTFVDMGTLSINYFEFSEFWRPAGG